jgi:branched-chain amino acid transport system permease protein
MKQNQIITLLFLAAAILFPIVIKDLYFMHMAILIGIYTLGAISVNLLLGYSGQLSLGHAAFFGVGAYVSALAYLKLGIPLWGGIFLAAVFSGILGFGVAKISLKLRGAYFVILTIGIAEVLKLVGLNWVGLTKGPMGLTDIAAPQINLGSLGVIDFGDKMPYFYLVLFFVVVCAFIQKRIIQSSIGRAVLSIRENEDLAECIGINCYKHLVIIVVTSAAIAGCSGALYAHYVSFIDPGVFAFFLSVNFVMMVIGGGQGTFSGPIVGAILFTLIPEWLRVFGNGRLAVYSLVVIFIVIFMSKGILYYLSRLLKLIGEAKWAEKSLLRLKNSK